MGHVPKLSTGIDVVDDIWGGFYEGGSYLVFGRASNDRGLLPLLFASQSTQEQPGLYLATSPPETVLSRPGGERLRRGAVELRQIPIDGDPAEASDEELAATLSALVDIVERERPHRVVVDDFMPFVGFHTFDPFRSSFIEMLERIDALDATLMLTMAEPANEESSAVIEFMRGQMTGALRIDATADGHAHLRRLTLLPNIGHVGDDAVLDWDIRPFVAPEPDRSGRRFRFADGPDAGPSPRRAQWADADTTPERPNRREVRSIRLGENGPAQRAAEPSHASRPGRIPGVPLGDTSHAGFDASRPEPPRPFSGSERPPSPASDAGGCEARPPEIARGSASAPAAFQPAFQEAAPLVATRHTQTSHTDRDAFRDRLQQQFLRYDVDQTPFVLVAMRMDRPEDSRARPFDFDFILDLVSESLRDRDDVFVDLRGERLVVMLAESPSDASQPFFARLKKRLREEAPQESDYLMQSVSAIVVPNGRPFRSAEEFLTYALDEQTDVSGRT